MKLHSHIIFAVADVVSQECDMIKNCSVINIYVVIVPTI